jgi:hypothetical protein
MKTYTSYINFDLRDFDVHKLLSLPFKINNAEIEVTYEVNEYNEISIINRNIILIDNTEPTNKQSDVILDMIDNNEDSNFYKKQLQQLVKDEYNAI